MSVIQFGSYLNVPLRELWGNPRKAWAEDIGEATMEGGVDDRG